MPAPCRGRSAPPPAAVRPDRVADLAPVLDDRPRLLQIVEAVLVHDVALSSLVGATSRTRANADPARPMVLGVLMLHERMRMT